MSSKRVANGKQTYSKYSKVAEWYHEGTRFELYMSSNVRECPEIDFDSPIEEIPKSERKIV